MAAENQIERYAGEQRVIRTGMVEIYQHTSH